MLRPVQGNLEKISCAKAGITFGWLFCAYYGVLKVHIITENRIGYPGVVYLNTNTTY